LSEEVGVIVAVNPVYIKVVEVIVTIVAVEAVTTCTIAGPEAGIALTQFVPS
jgi:hypothetical protein